MSFKCCLIDRNTIHFKRKFLNGLCNPNAARLSKNETIKWQEMKTESNSKIKIISKTNLEEPRKQAEGRKQLIIHISMQKLVKCL